MARGGLPSGVASRVEQQALKPHGLRVTLRPYQAFGARYMLCQARTVLGDEMGLGKTVQALAAMQHLVHAEGASRFMVIAPASLLQNWCREAARFTDLTPVLLRGTPQERRNALKAWKADGGLAVTSYATMANLALRSIGLDFLVLDEAHYVKNPGAKRSKAARVLVTEARRVALLSGTPMENRPAEFIELISMLDPALARGLRRFDTGVQQLGIGNQQFRNTVAPVYLRRNQEDVLHELPERLEMEEWVELGVADAVAYRAAACTGQLMTMRWAVTVGAGGEAAKVARLRELLDEHREDGRKVLVFSFFRRVLDVLHTVVPGGMRIDGSVSPDRRQKIIDDFTAAPDPRVLLAQIQAGGVGLNLQAASAVILMEPQWKPAVEEQAIARAHRMGQSRRVLVHRILARDTVDERLLEIMARKSAAFDDYARQSAVKTASSAATQTEVSIKRDVLQAELARLGLDGDAPPA